MGWGVLSGWWGFFGNGVIFENCDTQFEFSYTPGFCMFSVAYEFSKYFFTVHFLTSVWC